MSVLPPVPISDIPVGAATRANLQTGHEKAVDFLTYAAPSVVAGFADTLGTSLGVIDDESMAGTIQEHFPQFGNYYKENRETARFVGDMAGMFIPGMAATKAIRAGSWLNKLVKGKKSSTALDSIFTSGKSFNQLTKNVRARDLHLAGGEVNGIKIGSLNFATDANRKALVRSSIQTKALDSFKEAAAFEVGVLATMHSSETLYPSEFELVDHAMLFGGATGVFIGAEAAFLKRAIRNSAFTHGKDAYRAKDRAGLSIEDTVFMPGHRDNGITMYALQADAAADALRTVNSTTDVTKADQALAAKVLNSEVISYNTTIKEQVKKLGNDSPHAGVTVKTSFGDGSQEVTGVMNALALDPTTMLGTRSLERLPDSLDEILTTMRKRDDRVKKLTKEVADEQIILDLPNAPVDLAAKVTVKQQELADLTELQFLVNEADGTLTHARNRKPLFQDGERRISKSAATQTESAIYSVKVDSDPIYKTNQVTVGMDENFLAIIPETRKLAVGGIEITDAMAPSVFGKAAKSTKPEAKFPDRVSVGPFSFKPAPINLGKSLYREMSADNLHNIMMANRDGGAFNDIFAATEKELALGQGANRGVMLKFRDNFVAGSQHQKPGLDITGAAEYKINYIAPGALESVKISKDVAKRVRNLAHVAAKQSGLVRTTLENGDILYKAAKVVAPTFEKAENLSRFEPLSLLQRSGLYAAAQRTVENFDLRAPDKIILAKGDHHTRLDAIVELHKKYGDEIFNRVQLAPGWGSIDDVLFESIISKYPEFSRMQKIVDNSQGDKALLQLKKTQRVLLEDIVRGLNLPGTATGEAHPLVNFFMAAHVQGAEELPARTLGELRDFLRGDGILEGFAVEQMPELLSHDLNLRGGMMAIPEDAKPSLLIKRPIDKSEYTRDALLTQATMQRETILGALRAADVEGGHITKALMDMIEQAPETATARNLELLGGEGVQRGDRQAVTTGVFGTVGSPSMQAMNSLESRMGRVAEELIGNALKPHVPVFTKLRASNNQGDLLSLNTFIHARRQAWDMTGEVASQDGLHFFNLKDTPSNRKRWQTLFNEEMPENALMPSPSPLVGGKRAYKPLGITDLALAGADSLRTLGRDALNNTNAIKNAGGFGRTNVKEWWVPPKNLSRQEHVFLIDESGELYTVAHGRTVQEANRKAQMAVENADRPLMPVDRNDMSKYFKLQDDAFEKMLDFTDPLLQTGKATGKSVDPGVVETGADILNDAVMTINKQFQSIPRRTRALYFEPQLRQARMLYNAGEGTARAKGQTIWQHYVAATFGNQTINPNDAIGQTYSTIESLYDKFANGAFDKVAEIVRPVGARKTQISKLDRKAYDQYEAAMGSYNPFKDSVDFANRTFKQSLPPSMKQHMAKLNEVTSLMTLRLLDVGHAVLNMTSLAATIPGVIKGLKRMPHEAAEQHAARIGSFGRAVDGEIGMFDAGRAVTSAMHDLWTKPEVIQQAAKAGYFRQDVAEIMRTITAPRQGYVEGMVRKATDVMSFLSDKSEELSRSISFMTGYHIAQRGHNMVDKDAFAFAHRFANEVIGDYRPNNRPRIFQGAVGMPLGLFQTFAWNYFQRVFGYVENKQAAALITQYATQAAVFGGQTVPGFQQFQDFFASNYDGTVNPIDGIRNNLGEEAADWFLYGTLSNLPKLFGADDGIALTNRGDMNMHRVPGLWNVADTAPIKLLQNGWGAFSETFKSLRTNEGVNTQQLAEIAANYSIWRAGRNAIELYTGVSTDRRGQLISADTRTGIGIAARAVGLKPMREAKSMEAWYRIRSSEFSRRERMLNLRDAMRGAYRSNGSIDDEGVATAMRKYMDAGGGPENFAGFLMNQYMTSNTERSAKKLMEVMRDPKRIRDTKRLMEIQSLPPNDPSME